MLRTLVRLASWEPTFWKRQTKSVNDLNPKQGVTQYPVTVIIHRSQEMDDDMWRMYIRECIVKLQQAQKECDELARQWRRNEEEPF